MLENRRGQQIGEYGVLLGTVALAVLLMQTIMGRSVLGSLEYNSQQVLGPLPVLDDATTLDSQANTTVEELAPLPGKVSTTVDAPSYGVSTVGTLIADASEPIVGVAITGSYGKRLPAAPLALRSSATLAARPRRDVYLEAASRQKKGDQVTGPQTVEDLNHTGELEVSIEAADWVGGLPMAIGFDPDEEAQPVSIASYPVKIALNAVQGGLVIVKLKDGTVAVVTMGSLQNYAKWSDKGTIKLQGSLVVDVQTGLFVGLDTDGDKEADQTAVSFARDGSTFDALDDGAGHLTRVFPDGPGVKVSKDDLSKAYNAIKEQSDTGGDMADARSSLDAAGVAYEETTLSDLAHENHQTPSSTSASSYHQEYLNDDGSTPIVSVSDAVQIGSAPPGYDRNGDGQVDGHLYDTDGNGTLDTIALGSLLPSGVYGPPDFQGAAKIVSTPRVRLSNEATWKEAMATGQGLDSYAEYRAYYKVEHGNVAGAGRKGLKAWVADRFPIAVQVAPEFFSDVVEAEGGASEAAGGSMPTTPPLTTGSPLVGGQPAPSVKDKPQ